MGGGRAFARVSDPVISPAAPGNRLGACARALGIDPGSVQSGMTRVRAPGLLSRPSRRSYLFLVFATVGLQVRASRRPRVANRDQPSRLALLPRRRCCHAA